MMNNKLSIYAISLCCLITFGCQKADSQNSVNPKFEIASAEYEVLAQKALRNIESFEFSAFIDMLDKDVEYYLPDGDAGTRTSFIGKEAVRAFWNSYQENSGNDKMIVTDMVTVPIISKDPLNYSKLTGVMVLNYFSNEMFFGEEKTNVRMHWALHYTDDNKIDRIYSYYDRTPIIEAAKRNILKTN